MKSKRRTRVAQRAAAASGRRPLTIRRGARGLQGHRRDLTSNVGSDSARAGDGCAARSLPAESSTASTTSSCPLPEPRALRRSSHPARGLTRRLEDRKIKVEVTTAPKTCSSPKGTTLRTGRAHSSGRCSARCSTRSPSKFLGRVPLGDTVRMTRRGAVYVRAASQPVGEAADR